MRLKAAFTFWHMHMRSQTLTSNTESLATRQHADINTRKGKMYIPTCKHSRVGVCWVRGYNFHYWIWGIVIASFPWHSVFSLGVRLVGYTLTSLCWEVNEEAQSVSCSITITGIERGQASSLQFVNNQLTVDWGHAYSQNWYFIQVHATSTVWSDHFLMVGVVLNMHTMATFWRFQSIYFSWWVGASLQIHLMHVCHHTSALLLGQTVQVVPALVAWTRAVFSDTAR